jgi:hypothetical protein
MIRSSRHQSTASLIAAFSLMAVATAPILTSAPATAQLFPPQTNNPEGRLFSPANTTVTIPSGTTIPIRYNDAKKIVIAPNESLPLTLNVAANVRTRSGTILIPAGSQIVGQLQPVSGGSQFVAKELVFSDNKRQPLDATSDVITKTEEVRQGGDTSAILQGALLGGAAAAAIAIITGDHAIATEEVLGGAALGALGQLLLGKTKTEVIVINPNTDLNLTLRSNLALR